MRFLSFILLILGACAPCGYKYSMEGSEEFVIDSYRIKQGKFSILEFGGERYAPLPMDALCEYEDRIDEDDIIKIALFHPTRKDLEEAIAEVGGAIGFRVINGSIRLPGIDPVIIKGLTLDQARHKIQSAYDGEIKNVSLFIEYGERLHSKVELAGAVRIPQIPVNGRIRLYEVLAIAGIPNDANLFKSYVVRENRLLPVDLYKLIHRGDMSQNIVMRPKDKIFIADPIEASIMVMGEVGVPTVIPVPSGSISIREALAAAGGIPFTGNKRCIQVIRGSIICPKIYRLSWNHITYLPNDSLLLMPGDTVYVTEEPITKWNRFIDQLLPSGLLIDLGIKAAGAF